MPVVQNQEGTLILYRVVILDSEDNGLDVKNLMRELTITENIITHFTQGRIAFEDQNKLKESLDMKGNEKILISWKTTEDSQLKEMKFFVKNMKSITQKKENEIEEFSFELIDEKFEPLMIKTPIYREWVQKTKKEILTDIFDYYGISFESTSNDNEKIDYLITSDDIVAVIEDILLKGSVPNVLYSKNDKLVHSTYNDLFVVNDVKMLSTGSLVTELRRGAIKDLTKLDIYDRKEVFDDGINGYTLFDFNVFEENFEKQDIELDMTNKFIVEKGKQNISVNKNCEHISNYYLMNFLAFELCFPDSDFELGEKVSIQIKSTDTQEDTFSKYSGEYVIAEIKHIIDRNYKYAQILSVISK